MININRRYLAERPLPAYVFIPGKNPHPKKVGGHMEGEGDPVVPPLDPRNPGAHEELRYALDLYNFGYYWESHVYFEALWNAHKRKGPEADFLKALIKLGAAGVKFNIGQKLAGMGHLERARELLCGIADDPFLGFGLSQLITSIDEAISKGGVVLRIDPDWD